jgi:hypothetical protein
LPRASDSLAHDVSILHLDSKVNWADWVQQQLLLQLMLVVDGDHQMSSQQVNQKKKKSKRTTGRRLIMYSFRAFNWAMRTFKALEPLLPLTFVVIAHLLDCEEEMHDALSLVFSLPWTSVGRHSGDKGGPTARSSRWHIGQSSHRYWMSLSLFVLPPLHERNTLSAETFQNDKWRAAAAGRLNSTQSLGTG